MPLYEHVFLARQDVSNQQVETLTKEMTDAIAEGGGKVVKSEYWGLKGLAYKIKKNRKAHFSLLNIDAPAAAVAEMERRMSIQPDILRFLTIKVDQHEAALKEHGKTYEFHRYPGAGHGFFYYHRPNYRQEQAVDGWNKVFAFLDKHLK